MTEPTILNVSGGRYAELRVPGFELSILDARPEQDRPAKAIIAEHVAELREKAQRLSERAARIESLAAGVEPAGKPVVPPCPVMLDLAMKALVAWGEYGEAMKEHGRGADCSFSATGFSNDYLLGLMRAALNREIATPQLLAALRSIDKSLTELLNERRLDSTLPEFHVVRAARDEARGAIKGELASVDMLIALKGAADALKAAGKSFAQANPLSVRPNLYELHESRCREAIAAATPHA